MIGNQFYISMYFPIISRLLSSITQGNQRSVTVKKNIVGSFIIKGVSVIISLLLVPATIGYVNAELYGVWLTVASVMTWVNILDLGFTQGLKNKLTEALANNDYKRGKTLISTTYVMMLVIFFPMCLIIELLIPFVDWADLLNVNIVYSKDVTMVMHVVIALACLQMIVNVIVSVIAAFQKVALSNSFGVIGNVLSLCIILLLRYICSPSLLVLSFALGAMPIIVTIVATLILFNGRFKIVAPCWNAVDLRYTKELFTLGYKFFVINVQVLVLYLSTNILMSNVSSPIEVTRYNIAYRLLSVSMMAYSIITSPLWPAYTDAYARGDYGWMMNMRTKMIRVLWMSIFGCAVLVLLSPPLYHIWIGNEVDVPIQMTLIVALYVSIFCWQNLNGTIIVAMSKVKLNVIILTIGMLIHLPLAITLSHWLGCYGVVASMASITLAYALVYHVQVNKLLNQTATGIWNQ